MTELVELLRSWETALFWLAFLFVMAYWTRNNK